MKLTTNLEILLKDIKDVLNHNGYEITKDEFGISHINDKTSDSIKRIKDHFIYGEPGVGKTHLTKRLSDLQTSKIMHINWADFIQHEINQFNNAYNNSKISAAKEAQLLIIDDLGTEKASEYNLGLFYKILNSRIENKNSKTIITSNLSPYELKMKYDAVDPLQSKRVISRLKTFNSAKAVGKDLRGLSKADQIKEQQEVLTFLEIEPEGESNFEIL